MIRALVAVACLIGAATLSAQRPFGGFGFADTYDPKIQNPDYTGQFTFARIKYVTGPGGYYYRGIPAWSHGYVPDPRRGSGRAETNLMRIMDEVTYLAPRITESVVATFDDPELFKYPVAYLTEPGFWTMNERETAGLRAYLLKGGFLIVDDFRHDGQYNSGAGWPNLEENFRRALPELRLIPVDASFPVFHSFFEIDSLDIIPQAYDQARPEFYGLFENNDPKRRMLAVVNYSTDVSDFWEFSATGFRPIEESNEAYKLGVNYIIYGLTH
jgi:hypothetical protein